MGSDSKSFASAGAMPPPGRTQGPPLQIHGLIRRRSENYVGRARGPARTHHHTASPAPTIMAGISLGGIARMDGADSEIYASAGAMPPPGRTQGPPLQSGVARARPYRFIYGIARKGRSGAQEFRFGGGDAPAGADTRPAPTERCRKSTPGHIHIWNREEG